MQALDEFASKLIENEHYAHDHVAGRRDQLLQRRDRLYEAAKLRRRLLEESYKFQTFQRDCDETKSWIKEKLKTANVENYLVSTVVPAKCDSDFIFRLQSYKGLIIDRSLVY